MGFRSNDLNLNSGFFFFVAWFFKTSSLALRVREGENSAITIYKYTRQMSTIKIDEEGLSEDSSKTR